MAAEGWGFMGLPQGGQAGRGMPAPLGHDMTCGSDQGGQMGAAGGFGHAGDRCGEGDGAKAGAFGIEQRQGERGDVGFIGAFGFGMALALH